jgi:hypothetical protein
MCRYAFSGLKLRGSFSHRMSNLDRSHDPRTRMLIRLAVSYKRRVLIRQSTSTGLVTPRPPRLSTWV